MSPKDKINHSNFPFLSLSYELGRNPGSKHQIQSEYGDEQADARRDCRNRLARSNSQARTGTGNSYFSCSADHEQDGRPYRLTHSLAICATIYTYIHKHTDTHIHTRIHGARPGADVLVAFD